MTKKVLAELGALGIDKVESSFLELARQADKMTRDAGQSTASAPAFEAFPSFIPLRSTSTTTFPALIVDVGGTSVKVGLRLIKNGEQLWHLLFETEHANFRVPPVAGQRLVESFFLGVAQRSVTELRQLEFDAHSIQGCGLVWSNAMENFFDPEIGITACVAGRANYMKGEWFIEDLNDGDNLAHFFLRSFSNVGISPKRLVISNDTPLTLKALADADGGVVAATGLNGTIIKQVRELPALSMAELPPMSEIVCNGEIGGRFIIDQSLRTEADYIGLNTEAKTIEHLMAGKFVPKLFAHYIKTLAGRGVSSLEDLGAYLTSLKASAYDEFGMKDTSLTFMNPAEFLAKRKNSELYSGLVVDELADLARSLIRRSATLAAIVCYATISNQFDRKSSLKVALDSRLAREIPLFREVLYTKFEALLPKKVTAEIVMLQRILVENGKISIPMQGAALALDSL